MCLAHILTKLHCSEMNAFCRGGLSNGPNKSLKVTRQIFMTKKSVNTPNILNYIVSESYSILRIFLGVSVGRSF
jgi:hypothetical protein